MNRRDVARMYTAVVAWAVPVFGWDDLPDEHEKHAAYFEEEAYTLRGQVVRAAAAELRNLVLNVASGNSGGADESLGWAWGAYASMLTRSEYTKTRHQIE